MEDIETNFDELQKFLVGFKAVFDAETAKLPYHVNLIDELHANENAHSRILHKFLLQKDPVTEKFEVFENFLKFIVQKNSGKKSFSEIKISKPQITQEKERIDLWIRDDDYVIIFENKISWAVDQSKQIERYIDASIDKNDKEHQIFVLYLPSNYHKDPEAYSWGKYFNSDIHVNRYLKMSFKDDILPWLRDYLLPNIRLKDKYLSSAIVQYIDHLEGMFSLRTINNKMNMELQNFIKKELNLNESNPEQGLEIVKSKKEEMRIAMLQLDKIEEHLNFSHWYHQFKIDFKDFDIKKADNELKVEVIINPKFAVVIAVASKGIFYGIRKYGDKIDDVDRERIKPILGNTIVNESEWYGWDWADVTDVYSKAKDLIEKIINLK